MLNTFTKTNEPAETGQTPRDKNYTDYKLDLDKMFLYSFGGANLRGELGSDYRYFKALKLITTKCNGARYQS